MSDLIATPLYLLPGLDGTGELFAPLLGCLLPSIRPVVVPYPRLQPMGYDELVRFVADRLPPDQPFAILGESFSGPIAVRLAALRPPGLAAVILAATFVRNPVRWLPRLSRHLVGSWMFHLPLPAAAIRFFLADAQTSPEIVGGVQSATRGVSPAVLASRLREVLNVDGTSALRQCQVPMLYIAGRRDRLVTSRSIDLIRTLRPDLESVTLDAPHLVLQSQPQECARLITEFLSRQDSCS